MIWTLGALGLELGLRLGLGVVEAGSEALTTLFALWQFAEIEICCDALASCPNISLEIGMPQRFKSQYRGEKLSFLLA